MTKPLRPIYPLKHLRPGDSIILTCGNLVELSNARKAVRRYAKKNGILFESERCATGLRVKRLL